MKRWLPVMVWMLSIFAVSSIPSLPHIVPSAAQNAVATMAHVAEYAVLAWLLHRAMAPDARQSGAHWVSMWVVCVLYGISDEFHQSIVPGRDASPVDVLADGAGAALALSIIRLRGRVASP